MSSENGMPSTPRATHCYAAERLWEGIRFREIIDDNISIDGYWIGENGDIWSCWRNAGKYSALTDAFQRKMKQWVRPNTKQVSITFRGNTRFVARIVAKAFFDVSQYNNGYVVIHKNGDNTDNRVVNLIVRDLVDWIHDQTTGFGGRFKIIDALGLEILQRLMAGESQTSICASLQCNHKVVARIRKLVSDAMSA